MPSRARPTESQGDRQFEACRICDFDVVCPVARDRQWERKRDAPEVAPVRALMDTEAPTELDGAVVEGFADDGGISS